MSEGVDVLFGSALMTEYALPHGRATAPSPTAGAKISDHASQTNIICL